MPGAATSRRGDREERRVSGMQKNGKEKEAKAAQLLLPLSPGQTRDRASTKVLGASGECLSHVVG
jgi:hypothetical protein